MESSLAHVSEETLSVVEFRGCQRQMTDTDYYKHPEISLKELISQEGEFKEKREE
jgi:hypothetical protein